MSTLRPSAHELIRRAVEMLDDARDYDAPGPRGCCLFCKESDGHTGECPWLEMVAEAALPSVYPYCTHCRTSDPGGHAADCPWESF